MDAAAQSSRTCHDHSRDRWLKLGEIYFKDNWWGLGPDDAETSTRTSNSCSIRSHQWSIAVYFPEPRETVQGECTGPAEPCRIISKTGFGVGFRGRRWLKSELEPEQCPTLFFFFFPFPVKALSKCGMKRIQSSARKC